MVVKCPLGYPDFSEGQEVHGALYLSRQSVGKFRVAKEMHHLISFHFHLLGLGILGKSLLISFQEFGLAKCNLERQACKE